MRTKPWTPWFYIGPALVILGFYLVYPSIVTIYWSFFGPRSDRFVGLDNYVRFFTQEQFLIVLRNNLMWIIVATAVIVGVGVLLAVLLDRVRYESTAKSLVFMPMAISFVGASVIWKFMYAFRPDIYPQIGVLNAMRTALGYDPLAWLTQPPWINNVALIVVFIWMWAGYSMVLLSAAYKGIDRDMLEAARIDGANEWQVFWYVILPTLKSTIVVVATTIIVFVLKVFDIVYVMTNGNFGTEVLANLMFKQMYSFRNFGFASAVAVILFVAVIPIVILNIRRFIAQEEVR